MPRTTPTLVLACALLLACGGAPPQPARTDVDAVATLAKIAGQPDSPARRELITSLRRSSADAVHPALRTGFSSDDPTLRAAAVLVAGRRADGRTFTPELIAAAEDPVHAVRVAAARSLGALHLSDGFPVLQKNLSHPAPAVRLSSLRALGRIDPDRAASLPELARLQLDPNPQVAGLATKVARKTLR